jgi:hydrogenase expression/formation protein
MKKGYSKAEIIERLIQEYLDFKDIDESLAHEYAKAVYEECKISDISTISDNFIKSILDFNKADVTVGKQGVGCRGAGDFFVHKLIAELSETDLKAYLSPKSLDDAGAIRLGDLENFSDKTFDSNNLLIVSKMEGIHSRLSDFPFICGFHVISCNKLT